GRCGSRAVSVHGVSPVGGFYHGRGEGSTPAEAAGPPESRACPRLCPCAWLRQVNRPPERSFLMHRTGDSVVLHATTLDLGWEWFHRAVAAFGLLCGLFYWTRLIGINDGAEW